MQISPRKSDFIWNAIGAFFKLFSSFLLLPLVLSLLSGDLVGLWYVFLAIFNFVVLFQVGFVPAFSRSVAYCWSGARAFCAVGKADDYGSQVDYLVFRNLIIASKDVYRRISVICLIGMSVLGSMYIFYVSSGLPIDQYLYAWLTFCAAVFLNMYFGYYESLLRGIGNFSGLNKALVVSSLIQLASAGSLLFLGSGLLACSVGFLLQGICFRFLCSHFFKSFSGIGNCLAQVLPVPDLAEVRSIRKAISVNAYKDTAVSIANYIATMGNTLLCSAFLGLSESGAFSITLQLFSSCGSIASIVLMTYQPAMQSAFANGNKLREKTLSAKGITAFIGAYCIVSFFIIVAVMPFLGIFKPGFSADLSLSLLVALYIFFWRHTNLCATLLANANEMPYTVSFVVTSGVGLALNILLLFLTSGSVIALVAGDFIALCLHNAWRWPQAAAARLDSTYRALIVVGAKAWVASLRRDILS